MSLDSGKGRNNNIDLVKAIAAILVCFQHAAGTGFLSGYLLALSRIAVPLFMMITGYLYDSVIKKGKQKQQLKRYIQIAFGMFLLYLVYECGLHVVRHDLYSFLQDKFSRTRLVEFVLLNRPLAADHSWYMLAMIYTLFIAMIYHPMYGKRSIRRILIIAGIVGQLALGKYSLLLFGREFSSMLTRNAWFVGIPFFLIGIEIKELLIEHSKNSVDNNIYTRYLWLTIGFTILCIIERALLISLDLNASRDSYILTTPLTISVFIMLLTWKNVNPDNLMVRLGCLYTLPIYIIHPLLVKLEVRIFDMSTSWQFIGFFTVLGGSLAISMMYVRAKSIIMARKKTRRK